MIRHPVGRIVGLSIPLLTLLAAAGVCPAATPEQVDQAIQRGQTWLLANRSKDGTWEVVSRPQAGIDKDIVDVKSRQWGGLTALSTYALLASGVDRRTPEMKRAIEFLLTANIQSTYGLGLSSQLVLFIPEKDSRELVRRNTAMILAGMTEPSFNVLHQPQAWNPGDGFYGYWTGTPFGTDQPLFEKSISPRAIGTHMPPEWFDRSNSQYAVLGMWALADAGAEIRSLYWQIEDAAWKKAQLRTGGWNYNNIIEEMRDASASMTAAGIATLFITQDYTLDVNWSVCRGGIKNENIERGLHWMDQHIDEALAGNYYTMYGIERIGTASGRKYFGTKDWYKIGADYIVSHQGPDGSWSATNGVIPDTAFCLLFLSRGRAPVMMNKLEYTTDKAEKNIAEVWDERPRDVANLAKFAGREDESYFNWQVVNLNVGAEDLHDAPILFISGSQPLDFTKAEEDKLRQYVEQGGMILANADCGKDLFNKSFIALGKKLFPKYDFHQVSPNDFIFNEQFKDLRVKPKVMEMTNNVRKLLVLIPEADASKAWQVHSNRNEGLFGLGANIFLYAVDKKNLWAKGDSYIVSPVPTTQPTVPLKVARLDVGDNSDPEPGGWERMVGVMHNRYRVDLTVEHARPEALAGYKVAHLTGTGKVTFSATARAALKQFIDGGGTLIVDAAGGDIEFADSIENELGIIFPGARLDQLPDDHPIYNVLPDKKVGWRNYAVDKIGDRHHFKIRGVQFGTRTAIFFSREDLTAGIVGEPVDGIYGYDPPTATNLLAAMLLYVQGNGNPTTAPATAPTPAPPAK